jgi:cell volume regulation protein A
VIVILSYLFDISGRYSKIPGVILLVGLGMLIHALVNANAFRMPNMKPLLPVLGTLGLILIVMEASLDLILDKSRKTMMIKSISSGVVLFGIFVILFALILLRFMGYPLQEAIINAIPLGIISSAVAISSASNLNPDQKEFIIYESSISDIVGIMAFDFILYYQASFGQELVKFALGGLLTAAIAIITTSFLAFFLHKIQYHVSYVIIMTAVVLVYVLAKLSHLPALLIVLAFGLALSNNKVVETTFINRYVDFIKFRNDLESFKKIMREITFLVRSFFFIMFGYYTTVKGLFNPENLIAGLAITGAIFIIRWLFFTLVLRVRSLPVILFAPRGLITILLYLSIPDVLRIPLINEEVITLVILMTLLIMMIGNFLSAWRASVTVVKGNG